MNPAGEKTTLLHPSREAESALEDVERLRLSERAVLVGLAANVVLAAAKVSVGLAQNSQALLADGANSTLDVGYFVATLILVRLAAKEPDLEHPHGHAQSESIASLLIGAFIITTAAAIFYNSVAAALATEPPHGGPPALAVALGTIPTKAVLFAYTARISHRTANVAVGALAVDHRNDIFVSATVVVGIAGAALGYPILDPVAGAAVSFFILSSGLSVIRTAAEDLMGTLPHAEVASQIRALARRVPGVRNLGELRAYRFGPYLVLQVELEVDPDLNVEQAHAIATAVERTLLDNMPQVRQVYTHVYPASWQDRPPSAA